jgi:hypothetical protein
MINLKIEFRQINDKEFWIAENHTFLENNIIYVIAIGLQTDEIALEHLKVHKILVNQVQGKVNYLIDLNKAGKSTPNARKVWQKVSEDPDTNKVALFGIHPVARVLASFVMSVSNKKDMLFFKTKEDGLKWLLE